MPYRSMFLRTPVISIEAVLERPFGRSKRNVWRRIHRNGKAKA